MTERTSMRILVIADDEGFVTTPVDGAFGVLISCGGSARSDYPSNGGTCRLFTHLRRQRKPRRQRAISDSDYQSAPPS